MSTNMFRGLLARASAVVLTAVVATGAALAPATPASLAPEGRATAETSTIDPDATGSITIHRYDGVSTGTAANGLQDTALESNAKGIAGSTFAVQRAVDYDLTTENAWVYLAELNGGAPANLADVPGQDPKTTDASGTVTFAGLPVGAYWVTETGKPADHPTTKPFLVTIPFTHPVERTTWVYDAHVYPKSTGMTVSKTLNDHEVTASGNLLTWTIEAELPVRSATYVMDSFLLTDYFNGHLQVPATTDGHDPITVEYKVGDVWHTAVAGTDYWAGWDIPGAGSTKPGDQDANRWSKIQMGLQKDSNKAILPGATAVRMTIRAIFDSLTWDLDSDPEDREGFRPADMAGVDMTNTLFDRATADASMRDAEWTEHLITASDDLDSKWGTITVQKTDGSGNPLQGAEFMVFDSEAKAKALLNAATPEAREQARLESILFNEHGYAGEQREFASDGAGVAKIRDLRYSGYAQEETFDDTDPRFQTYYVVESKAAPGYELSPKIVEVVLDGDETIQFKDVAAKAGFVLPLAGGAGILAIVVLGLSIAVIAFAVIRREQRRDVAA